MRKLCAFTGSVAEKIKFCASRLSAADRADIYNVRGIQREDPFDALIAYYASNGKGLVYSAALPGDHRAGKGLNAGLVAFLYPAFDVDGVADLKIRDFFLQAFAFNRI